MGAGAASDSFPVLSDLTLHTGSTCLPLIHEEVLLLHQKLSKSGLWDWSRGDYVGGGLGGEEGEETVARI